jgi:colicin import membrane protein
MTVASGARSDRVLSISLSVLVHAAILGALLWGWWQYHTRRTATPPSLAIQATVVRAAPATAPPPVAAPTPPPPTPAESAALQAERERAEAARAAAAAAAQAAERAAAEHAAAIKAQEQAEAQAAAEAAQRAQEEAERQARLDAERKAKEEAALKAKQDAQREAQRLQQQLQAEQAQRQRETDLQSQLQAEEHLQAVESSPAKAEYLALIQARISRAWIRPPSVQPGARCTVHLTQIPGGEITHVNVEGCNGDDALRESVETAAYKASPLPAPSDPALFDPNLTVTFAPDD